MTNMLNIEPRSKKIYVDENPEKRKETQEKYRSQNKEELKEKHREYNENNRETINAKEAVRRQEKRDATTEEMRFLNFSRDIIDGLNFMCFSCNRILFIKQ